ncbi:MAG TPA: hypothetical protein PKE06_10995 [Flavilitoribacter sp.]|nr:hypothetical protein [Lewinella sp.]MCB9281325.1 hypothetical protein [Lewinellaceae bacterium]HMQ61186.1 hypothetical protein [Flavilitoribacter sp.]
MKFVSEQIIETVADELDTTESAYEAAVMDLEERQPVILAYLFTEDFEAFSQQERDFILYLLIVLWKAIERVNGEVIPATEDNLMDAEEKNWSLLQDVKATRFHERLDVFFQDYPQEDLLAFVEDALSDEEDEWVTKEGREAVFITLKSIIDCWTQA